MIRIAPSRRCAERDRGSCDVASFPALSHLLHATHYLPLLAHIGDFRNWKDHDAYKEVFDRLLRDLKAEKTVASDK